MPICCILYVWLLAKLNNRCYVHHIFMCLLNKIQYNIHYYTYILQYIQYIQYNTCHLSASELKLRIVILFFPDLWSVVLGDGVVAYHTIACRYTRSRMFFGMSNSRLILLPMIGHLIRLAMLQEWGGCMRMNLHMDVQTWISWVLCTVHKPCNAQPHWKASYSVKQLCSSMVSVILSQRIWTASTPHCTRV